MPQWWTNSVEVATITSEHGIPVVSEAQDKCETLMATLE